MPKPKVLALVMAGGEGSRLEALSERRAKPALPYAGVYRPLDLDDPAWPILGRATHRLPARVEGSARLDRALLSPGTVVAGEVIRSVLGPGVVADRGVRVGGDEEAS